MADVWWYARDGAQLGPFPKVEIDRLIERGLITDDTLLWSEGMDTWQPLSTLLTPRAPPLPKAHPTSRIDLTTFDAQGHAHDTTGQ